ncbi:FliA/WhiG family RNA polymerase sigma factor [Anaerovibrio sp.]|uniref:FliA/WhiG family RNA polymerase sigma factor n=1 Tax=Anaerovibrio sp. TaxID=1872532 RepID=UPI003F18DE30
MEIRNQLVEHYLPLVNIIAGRLAMSLPSHVDRDDLIISGYFGLMDAVDRYDIRRGNKFETYAGIRISGAMKDELRSRDWISVSLRQKIRKYESAVVELEGRLGRSATDEELACELKMSVEQVHHLEQQINAATVIPLGEYMKSEAAMTADTDPHKSAEYVEIRETLAKALDELTEKEKLVVSLYYYDELTMKEISLIMHLSEARICQLHTKAMFKLRGFLANIDGI